MPASDEEILAFIAANRGAGREVESPDKAVLVWRDFVRDAVRRSVLELGAYRRAALVEMARAAGVPDAEIDAVVDYIRRELVGLHEGNAIRYRLRPEDPNRLDRSTLTG